MFGVHRDLNFVDMDWRYCFTVCNKNPVCLWLVGPAICLKKKYRERYFYQFIISLGLFHVSGIILHLSTWIICFHGKTFRFRLPRLHGKGQTNVTFIGNSHDFIAGRCMVFIEIYKWQWYVVCRHQPGCYEQKEKGRIYPLYITPCA